jgi:hypothetical protein
MGTLEEKCADVILDALGEKPDLIQQLIGQRAIDRLEKTIRKKERRSAEIRVKTRAATEIGILVPAMIRDILRGGIPPIPIVECFKDADPDLVERAWVIARQAIETVDGESWHRH